MRITTDRIADVKAASYALVQGDGGIDRENSKLVPSARESLEKLLGNTVDHWIYSYCPEGAIRITLTVEAL